MPAAWNGKRLIAVVSACMNRDGTPGFVWNEVEVTHDEYEEGLHYQLVMDRLLDSGYEEPCVHFDVCVHGLKSKQRIYPS